MTNIHPPTGVPVDVSHGSTLQWQALGTTWSLGGVCLQDKHGSCCSDSMISVHTAWPMHPNSPWRTRSHRKCTYAIKPSVLENLYPEYNRVKRRVTMLENEQQNTFHKEKLF